MLPTEVVAETPVKGTPISTFNDPVEVVAETPVKEKVTSDTGVTVPKEVVAETPVSPMTSAGVIAPTLVVAETPLGLTTASSTDPQPFSPQFKVPHQVEHKRQPFLRKWLLIRL